MSDQHIAKLIAKIAQLERQMERLSTLDSLNYTDWTDWTPTITYSGGTTDPTSETIAGARYCQIGKVVHVIFQVDITRGSSGDRTVTIVSLPVTPENTYSTAAAYERITSGIYTPCGNDISGVSLALRHGTMIRDGRMSFQLTYEAA